MELNKLNYFSVEMNTKYCGSTQFKEFCMELGGCEAKAIASMKGEFVRETTTDMLFGKAVHAFIEGTLPEFKLNNPDLYKKDGTLLAKFDGISECCEILATDPNMRAVLAGEKEVIMTASWGGLDWKIMMDVYNGPEKFFTDQKVMRDFQRKWMPWLRRYGTWIEYWGYQYQMAIYAETERVAMGRDDGDWIFPHINALTKQSPPDRNIYIGFKEKLPELIQFIKERTPRIAELKAGLVEPIRCENCEYCRKSKLAPFIDYTSMADVESGEVEQ